ncbi:hypothetical protein [Anoxybacillus sp. PDR2]|uniref:hypothetical protein n=1 Tax=Anoxybacillus sp. PDR2 TaxID=1636720 RepID=UPI0019150166|nr:hypothetical protein [Anoxybacillus sp. PDR2]
MDEIERERSIQLQPIKRIAQLRLEPSEENNGRVIPDDVVDLVKEYEYRNGRLNIRQQKAFRLIDFTSESTNEETRFIIVTNSLSDLLRNINYEDYVGIDNSVFIYVVENNEIKEEIQLEKTLRIL